MSTPRALVASALAACLLASVAAPVAAKKPPENWDGLELKKVKGIDRVYVRPNVQFTPYKSVILDATEVEFSKNWEKSFDFHDRPSASDMERIKRQLSELMHERYLKELVDHGYTVVDTPAEDTLRVGTAIIDLFINAPDTSDPGISKSYTTSAGRMTLVLEARDGPTGQLLARAVDKREDDNFGGRLTWTNSTTNMNDARIIIDVWAKQLREALDRLNGKEK
jgi:uncharacterized protein DUF3313